jgi:4-hydroxy-tetrahydrodipicolinate synthase
MMTVNPIANFGGIHCVLYALFDANGALDRDAMRVQTKTVLAAGVNGVTVLGLATEVQKLSEAERRLIIDWAAKDVDNQVPLSVTISGNSVKTQRDLVAYSLDRGADWLILQPPLAGTYGATTYLDFFAAVADGFDTIFSIQNAPQYLGRGLGTEDITGLIVRNPGFSLIKSETCAVDLAELVNRVGKDMTVLNGRGGLEMIDCLRAGAQGFILAPDLVDHSKRIFDLWQSGDVASAESHYRQILPAITFIMQSIEHLICYGKRVFGARAGIPIYDRAPAISPTSFGLSCVDRIAKTAGSIGGSENA